jgi:hypothetical protein
LCSHEWQTIYIPNRAKSIEEIALKKQAYDFRKSRKTNVAESGPVQKQSGRSRLEKIFSVGQEWLAEMFFRIIFNIVA